MIKARRTMGIMILLISLVVLLWGIWPQPTLVRTSPIVIDFATFPIPEVSFKPSNTEISLMDDMTFSAIYPLKSVSLSTPILETPSLTSIPPHKSENRLLTLEWQSRLRVGDIGTLRSTLALDQQASSPIENNARNDDLGNVTFQNQDSPVVSNIVVEAYLDMPGMQVTPIGEIRESLHPGQPAMFLWSVRAPKIGTYQGTIWLHARLIPLEGGSETRSLLLAPRVETQVVNFLGLGGSAARILGSVGIVVGSVLGLDGLFFWFWNHFVDSYKSGSIRAKHKM